jgi:hypothetical protein
MLSKVEGTNVKVISIAGASLFFLRFLHEIQGWLEREKKKNYRRCQAQCMRVVHTPVLVQHMPTSFFFITFNKYILQ